MSVTPQHLLLLIACLVASLNNSSASPVGPAATVSSLSGNRMEDSHCSSYIAVYGVSVAQISE
jgi:hypothetical protein